MRENKTIYVILGLLSHEPMTGYDIKKRIDVSLKYFWSASFGSIYPALQEMEQRQLVTKSQQPNMKGREKIVYEITPLGREHLREWLQLPVEKDELRYETLLRLFLGKEAGAEANINLLNKFQSRYESQLPMIQAIMKSIQAAPPEEDHKYYYLTALFGEKVFKAYIEWAKEAIKILEEN